ncbi:MAG: M24 family metallopeptidase, partial [Tepidisphaeraceae bacterium]
FQVQQHMMARFAAMNLETPDPPIVAVNAHSGDPHFEVSETSPATINRGDWVLIDLWARVPGDENIFSDITWVGFAGKDVPSRMRDVFEVVRGARDACVARAVTAFAASQPVHGWELDEAARKVIIDAGFGQFIRHRTGHSLSPGPRVHGVGVNIDNLETHDTRQMLPEIGFTVEPGVYLPEFGVRLEIDVFNDPVQGPTVTSGVQDDIVIVA